MTPALLVLGVGNRSRGDDALGPLLLDRLRSAGLGADGKVELMEDFQLQVEHALDLQGRRAVLFVDASHGAVDGGAGVWPIAAERRAGLTTHALSPQAVLAVYEQVVGAAAPPAFLLAIAGCRYGLGQPLSDDAELHLQRAVMLARGWVDQPAAVSLQADMPVPASNPSATALG